MTPADTIIKALGDLTQALKGRRNMNGIKQIKALTKKHKLLNNIPITNKTPTRKVIFNEATKPPQEVQADPSVNNISKSIKEPTAISTAIVDKPLTINTPPPRVETSVDKTSILNMPPPRVVESSKADREKVMLNSNRINFNSTYQTQQITEQESITIIKLNCTTTTKENMHNWFASQTLAITLIINN